MLALAHEAPTWILPFIFVLTIVVTVHEFGHFIAARLCGVAVDQFSIGFGRAIVKRRDRQGTEWRIGWIPLGGYVRFAGDEYAASVPDSEDLDELRKAVIAHEGVAALKRYYAFKPIWQRAIIAAAGPFANFGLSIGLLATLFLIFGEAVVPAKLTAVMPNSHSRVSTPSPTSRSMAGRFFMPTTCFAPGTWTSPAACELITHCASSSTRR